MFSTGESAATPLATAQTYPIALHARATVLQAYSVRRMSDGGELQLWVQTSGARLWQLAYRHDGRQRQLALGAYPELSLAGARIKREESSQKEKTTIMLARRHRFSQKLKVFRFIHFHEISENKSTINRHEALDRVWMAATSGQH